MSVLVTMCGHVWRFRRIRRKPKSRHFERLLTLEGTRGEILCKVVIGGRLLPDKRKRSIIMDRQNWFNGLAKDAGEYEDRRTVLTRWIVYLGGVRLEWKKPVIFRNDEDTNAYTVGRRTDEHVNGSMVGQMLRRLESISSTMKIRKFRGKRTSRTSARCVRHKNTLH